MQALHLQHACQGTQKALCIKGTPLSISSAATAVPLLDSNADPPTALTAAAAAQLRAALEARAAEAALYRKQYDALCHKLDSMEEQQRQASLAARTKVPWSCHLRGSICCVCHVNTLPMNCNARPCCAAPTAGAMHLVHIPRSTLPCHAASTVFAKQLAQMLRSAHVCCRWQARPGCSLCSSRCTAPAAGCACGTRAASCVRGRLQQLTMMPPLVLQALEVCWSLGSCSGAKRVVSAPHLARPSPPWAIPTLHPLSSAHVFCLPGPASWRP